MIRRPAPVRLDSLLRCACEVMVARGLAGTRAADVAATAGVSQALVFYHFGTRERLLAEAYSWAAEQDLARLDAVLASPVPALEKVRKILKLYAPAGTSTAWTLWIDGWSHALRSPELERVSRRLEQRWKQALTDVVADGTRAGEFTCPDPRGSAWRMIALLDGLAVQVTVHRRSLSRRELGEWVALVAGRELGVPPEDLT